MITTSETNALSHGLSTGEAIYLSFENNGATGLNVDGSVTPVVFTLPLPVGTDFLLNAVNFVIGTEDVIALRLFGSLAALTNGVDFSANGELIVNIKNNGEVMLTANNANILSAKVEGIASGILQGTWDMTETFSGNSLRVIDNDLKITINDDLTLMDYFRVSAHAIKIN